jgi:hypothetical protein
MKTFLSDRDVLLSTALDVYTVGNLGDGSSKVDSDHGGQNIFVMLGVEKIGDKATSRGKLYRLIGRNNTGVKVRVEELSPLPPSLTVGHGRQGPVEAHPNSKMGKHSRNTERGCLQIIKHVTKRPRLPVHTFFG